MKKMRAKLKVDSVTVHETVDIVNFTAVCKKEPYGEDGSDEDNTFAKFSPSAQLAITIANPELLGSYRPGQVFYVDLTPVAPET